MSDLLPFLAPWSGRALTLACILLGLAFAAYFLRRKKLKVPHCPHCGYNLTAATSNSCAECGHVPKTPAALYRARRRWRLVILGLLISLAMPAYVVQRRIRMYGWDYYLSLYPLYAIWPTKIDEDIRLDHGIHVVTRYDRRCADSLWGLEPEWRSFVTVTAQGKTVWPSATDLKGSWRVGTVPIGFGQQFHMLDLDGSGHPSLIITYTSVPAPSQNPNIVEYGTITLYVLTFDCSAGQTKLLGTVEIPTDEYGNCTGEFIGPDAERCYSIQAPCITKQSYIWLKFRHGKLVVDVARSRRPMPDPKEIADALADDRQGYSFIGCDLACQMICSGHLAEGQKLLKQLRHPLIVHEFLGHPIDDARPLSQQIMDKIAALPYGKDILDMSNGPTSAPAR